MEIEHQLVKTNGVTLHVAAAGPADGQSVGMCNDGRLVVIDDATHWVQHDAADRVNALLLDFLAQG